MMTLLCRSCPPGPWLPASSAPGVSGSRECHQLAPAAGQSSGDQPPASSLTSSFSVTQRLNNQLSVDSSGSGGGSGDRPAGRQSLPPRHERVERAARVVDERSLVRSSGSACASSARAGRGGRARRPSSRRRSAASARAR